MSVYKQEQQYADFVPAPVATGRQPGGGSSKTTTAPASASPEPPHSAAYSPLSHWFWQGAPITTGQSGQLC